MGIDDLLTPKRDDILRTAARYGASNVRVFGSVARGEAGPDSDVDLLKDYTNLFVIECLGRRCRCER